MNNKLQLIFICFASVGLAAIFGLSEEAGLFGAIIAGGTFILGCLEEAVAKARGNV